MSKYKAAIITLCFLTILASFMLTRFFKKELSKEIDREQQRLESMVFRTSTREYQRVNILIQSVKQIQSETEEDLKISLEQLLNGYGQYGQIPYLIKNAAYSLNNQLSIVIEKSETSLSWQQLENLPAYAHPDQPLKKDQLQIKNTEDYNSSYIIFSQPIDKSAFLIVELDRNGIDQYYVQPALTEALNQYNLEWVKMDKEAMREDLKNRKDGKYPFKPLQILTSRDHGQDMKLMIPLPSGFDRRHPFIPEEEGDQMKRARNLFFPDLDSAPFRYSENVLIISSEGAPYYSSLEKRTALNWLMSQVILLGIGLVFLILILQLKRTKDIRIREKEFVASMTHELRTPITVIQSAADNLSKGIISEEKVARYGQMMKDQTERLSNMIEEILLFSSLEARNAKNSTPVETDIIAFLNKMEENFAAMADEKETTISWDYEGLPSRLYTYPSEIKLILSNLVSNALHHAAGIKINVRCHIPDRLKVTVEDSGPGIPIYEQKKIFDPFYRTLSSREQQTQGSGLGLFIARKKTELIKGELKLESPFKRLNGEKSSGCRFTLVIPVQVFQKQSLPYTEEGLN